MKFWVFVEFNLDDYSVLSGFLKGTIEPPASGEWLCATLSPNVDWFHGPEVSVSRQQESLGRTRVDRVLELIDEFRFPAAILSRHDMNPSNSFWSCGSAVSTFKVAQPVGSYTF